MMLRLLLADWQKLKKIPVLGTILIGIIGLCGVVSVQSYFWSDKVSESKGIFIIAILNLFLHFTLMVIATLLPSIIAGNEHDSNNWKKIFSLPISKIQIFFSKAILVISLLAITSLLIVLGSIVIWSTFVGFDQIIWTLLLKQIAFSFLASLPTIAIQLWLSLSIKNQAVPILIGIIGAVSSLFLARSSSTMINFLPWSYPPLSTPLLPNSIDWVWKGLLVGLLIFILGAVKFSKQETH
ncbi:ABC transporter permease [Lysinibacillus xylanilyticus]|uniref:ABC transporter permease n=1 Tax=Lysinibacillus xylanilyticus TaxID=582475 RepID=UPI00083C9F6B|nr:ABC transporter permease [Lysinibacillus xylanilyticus]